MGGGGKKTGGPRYASFSPVTSTNLGISLPELSEFKF